MKGSEKISKILTIESGQTESNEVDVSKLLPS